MGRPRKPKALFAENEESGGLRVNQAFAARYEHKKQREELAHLQTKYGAQEEESSSSCESEDEAAAALTPALERGFLRTLSLLKANDPRLKDPTVKLYDTEADESDDADNAARRAKPAKPMFLKDHERRRLETKGAMAFVSDDDEDEGGPAAHAVQHRAGYDVDQRKLRQQVLQQLHGAADAEGDEGADEGGFVMRQKTQVEQLAEEDDYMAWLAGQGAGLAAAAKRKPGTAELEPLQRFWSDKGLSEDDRFLRDYITGRQWRPEDAGVPSYNEVVDAEDEAAVEQAEAYELQYNFRFEDPNGIDIKTYPRIIDSSVRKKDSRRKQAREEKTLRRDEEKRQKTEDLNRLKNLKQQEILERLRKIQEISGADLTGIEQVELDADFDPDRHDAVLEAVFNEDFYAQPELEKPVFNDLEDLGNFGEEGEYAGDYSGDEHDGPYADDPDFNMDADYDAAANAVYAERAAEDSVAAAPTNVSEELSRARFRKLEKAALAGQVKNTDLTAKLDEYYNLDCEDVVAGVPCRFKYREVPATTFGLSIEDILTADEKELNAWASLKKITRYRPEEHERNDMRAYKKRAKQKKLLQQMLPSIYREDPSEAQARIQKELKLKARHDKEQRKKRKREERELKHKDMQGEQPSADHTAEQDAGSPVSKKAKHAPGFADAPPGVPGAADVNAAQGAKKKKRKHKKEKDQGTQKENNAEHAAVAKLGFSHSRLAAYGLTAEQQDKKEKRRKRKEAKETAAQEQP